MRCITNPCVDSHVRPKYIGLLSKTFRPGNYIHLEKRSGNFTSTVTDYLQRLSNLNLTSLVPPQISIPDPKKIKLNLPEFTTPPTTFQLAILALLFTIWIVLLLFGVLYLRHFILSRLGVRTTKPKRPKPPPKSQQRKPRARTPRLAQHVLTYREHSVWRGFKESVHDFFYGCLYALGFERWRQSTFPPHVRDPDGPIMEIDLEMFGDSVGSSTSGRSEAEPADCARDSSDVRYQRAYRGEGTTHRANSRAPTLQVDGDVSLAGDSTAHILAEGNSTHHDFKNHFLNLFRSRELNDPNHIVDLAAHTHTRIDKSIPIARERAKQNGIDLTVSNTATTTDTRTSTSVPTTAVNGSPTVPSRLRSGRAIVKQQKKGRKGFFGTNIVEDESSTSISGNTVVPTTEVVLGAKAVTVIPPKVRLTENSATTLYLHNNTPSATDSRTTTDSSTTDLPPTDGSGQTYKTAITTRPGQAEQEVFRRQYVALVGSSLPLPSQPIPPSPAVFIAADLLERGEASAVDRQPKKWRFLPRRLSGRTHDTRAEAEDGQSPLPRTKLTPILPSSFQVPPSKIPLPSPPPYTASREVAVSRRPSATLARVGATYLHGEAKASLGTKVMGAGNQEFGRSKSAGARSQDRAGHWATDRTREAQSAASMATAAISGIKRSQSGATPCNPSTSENTVFASMKRERSAVERQRSRTNSNRGERRNTRKHVKKDGNELGKRKETVMSEQIEGDEVRRLRISMEPYTSARPVRGLGRVDGDGHVDEEDSEKWEQRDEYKE